MLLYYKSWIFKNKWAEIKWIEVTLSVTGPFNGKTNTFTSNSQPTTNFNNSNFCCNFLFCYYCFVKIGFFISVFNKKKKNSMKTPVYLLIRKWRANKLAEAAVFVFYLARWPLFVFITNNNKQCYSSSNNKTTTTPLRVIKIILVFSSSILMYLNYFLIIFK